MHKYYYTYKITLLKGSLASHYYFGQHRTNNLNDEYAGSGRIVNAYYKKYGKIEHQTYIKEIIAFYNSDKGLNEAEKELIGDKYKTDQLCLNLCPGGGLSEESCKKISNTLIANIPWNKGKHLSEETRKKQSISHKGKHHSEETKKKISKNSYTKLFGHSEETKKKISENHKGKNLGHIPWNKGKTNCYSEETKNKMKKAAKNRAPVSEETKRKRSEALKGKPGPNIGKHRVYHKDGTFHLEK